MNRTHLLRFVLLCVVGFWAAPSATQAQTDPIPFNSPNPEPVGVFGSTVSGVPDTDGDGRGDVLIGAYLEDAGGGNTGRSYLFSGATGALLQVLESPNARPSGHFGTSVSGLTDVDGDGRGDLLVGAAQEDGSAFVEGRAYLFSGATGQLLHALESPISTSNGLFGWAVSGVPDTDGDQRDDLLVGAHAEDGSALNSGRAYLFSGATGDLLQTLESPNPEANGFLGWTVAGVPDTDGDGRGDLLIGARNEDGEVSDVGRAYLFSGATGDLLQTIASPNPESGGQFAHSVSGLSDVDGDGRGDLLIGARNEDDGGPDAGRAYIFSGATGDLLQTLESPAPEPGGNVGHAVAGVPDMDGDGRNEVLIGARVEDGGATNAGRVYVFSGTTGALLQTVESPNPESTGQFGFSVAGVQDADGDGRGDLLIGAGSEDGGAVNAGRAYLFRGAPAVFACDAQSEVVEADCDALVALYDATGGDGWTDNAGWFDLNTPIDEWRGVTVTGDRVTTLDLTSNGLTGTIPPAITQLTALTVLRLRLNALTGEIPAGIGALGQLEVLDVNTNQLGGGLPAGLWELTSLRQLTLFRNDFTGVLPPDIGQLTQLTSLGLGENALAGTLPDAVGDLASLQALDINSNQIGGPLPASMGTLAELQSLVVNGTPLSGPIPLTFVDLSALQTFNFGDTELCEPTDPAFQAWLMQVPNVESTGVACDLSPVAVDDAAETAEDVPVVIAVLANDEDPDSEALTVESVGSAENGTVEIVEGAAVRYTPDADFFGEDAFTYVASDGVNNSGEATVTVTVTPVNDAPTASTITDPSDGTVVLIEGDPAETVIVAWTVSEDVEGDAVTYTWEAALAEGGFDDPVFEVETEATSLEVTFDEIATVLDDAGVEVGEVATLFHRVVSSDGEAATVGALATVTLERGVLTNTEDSTVPTRFAVGGVYPNPTAGLSRIKVDLPWAADVTLEVYDTTGRRIVLKKEALGAGRGMLLSLNGFDLSTGVYHYRLIAETPHGEEMASGRLTVVR